jgi:adenine-specific DNA-methyltransferase
MEKKNYKRVNLTSADLNEEKLEQLSRILPETFCEGRIDWQKLKEMLGADFEPGVEKFSFSWAGKTGAVKNVLVPSKATLKPAKDESVKFDESENIFIEGDNLEVLKLLQKAYFEKVKMIYIDPPYNTGGDFVYKDDFSAPLKGYLEQTGQIDGNGNKMQTNRETNGRYHSDWLSMMYPRLKLAWNLLRDDGVIFISIDDNEVHHLRMLMDEIFGEENFRNTITVSRVKKNIQEREAVKALNQGVGYVLCYSKSADALIVPATKFQKKEERWHAFDAPGIRPTMEYELFGQKPPTGRHWMYEKERALEMMKAGDLKLSTGANKPQYRLAASDETNLDTNWTDLIESDSTWVKNGGKNFKLIQRLLQVCNDKNGLILDFFAGSGTTAEAVLRQNDDDGGMRKFILVQLPEKIDSANSNYDSKYKTITEITKTRIHSLFGEYEKHLPLNVNGFKVFKLDKSNYADNNFEFDPEISDEENKTAFLKYLNKARQVNFFEKTQELDVVYENIIKEGLSLNSKIQKTKIAESGVYQIADGEKQLLICLENKISPKTIKELTQPAYKGKLFICLDNALDDTTKANLALNVELKTI